MAATITTFRQRLRQAALVGISCLLCASALTAATTGTSGLASAWPLILLFAMAAAVVGGWIRPQGIMRALLLGFVVAVAGSVAVVVYVVLELTY